ncbi:MAG: hypothetical protein QOH47_248 [Sphingomonadales bacterium]|nr:hypothetical protein [Sphingomonadales bacterium]
MSIRLLVAAAAVIAVPMAVMGQPSPTTTAKRKQAPERRFCVVDNDPGNRLRRISRCYTKVEYDAMRADSRRAIDRIQTMRPSY